MEKKHHHYVYINNIKKKTMENWHRIQSLRRKIISKKRIGGRLSSVRRPTHHRQSNEDGHARILPCLVLHSLCLAWHLALQLSLMGQHLVSPIPFVGSASSITTSESHQATMNAHWGRKGREGATWVLRNESKEDLLGLTWFLYIHVTKQNDITLEEI